MFTNRTEISLDKDEIGPVKSEGIPGIKTMKP